MTIEFNLDNIDESIIDAVCLDPNLIVIRENLSRIRKDMGDITEMANSIQKFGQFSPILITRSNELIAGERRLLACRQLGRPVIVLYRDQVDDVLLREIELEENIKRKDMTWQEQILLVQEITTLKQAKFGIKGAGKNQEGWSLQDTADLMGKSRSAVTMASQLAGAMKLFPEIAGAKTEDDARKLMKKVEEQMLLAEFMSRKEKQDIPDAFALASASYIVKDAMLGLPTIDASTCDFADVDTPYGIDLSQMKKTSQSTDALRTIGTYIEVPKEDFITFTYQVAHEVYRILKQDAFCIWWFGAEWYQPIKDVLHNVGFQLDVVPCLWYAGSKSAQTMQPQTLFAKSYDTFFLCRKGKPVLHKPGRHNVFECPKVDSDKKIHPTEKPLQLYKEIIETICFPYTNAIVPFLGSGNALRALAMHKCSGFGFDLDNSIKNRFLLRVEEDIEANLYK